MGLEIEMYLEVHRPGWLSGLAGWEGSPGHRTNGCKAADLGLISRGLQAWLASRVGRAGKWEGFAGHSANGYKAAIRGPVSRGLAGSSGKWEGLGRLAGHSADGLQAWLAG